MILQLVINYSDNGGQFICHAKKLTFLQKNMTERITISLKHLTKC